MNPNFRNFALWVIIFLLVVALVMLFQNPGQKTASTEINFSHLLTEVDQGHVRDVTISGPEIAGHFTDNRAFSVYAPNDPSLVQTLVKKGVNISAKPPSDGNNWLISLLVNGLPLLAFLALWIFVSRQMQGAGGKAMGFGKSKAKLLTEAHGRVTFEDVAGVDEAKEDLQEIVEFLRDPQKFQRLGGRIPRGVLLVGPPGTGKTLLARAIAGEANVPFFTISGTDFVEMFVGVGASRVRDMFEQAKKNAPCIIFIDEIDAVGRHRGAGLGGGNDEREQTLNQLLVEMDLVNEAALMAARRGKRIVTMVEFEDSKDKIMMGAERRTLVMTEQEKMLTAYHEGGHALVALNVPATDPVHKATIIPRGRALGMVMQLPERDKLSMSYEQMTSRLAVLMGGRVSEEIIFGKEKVTSGAQSDIQQATKLARAMVTQWGFSDALGSVMYGENQEEVFVGYSMGKQNALSEETSRKIDAEVRRLVEYGLSEATRIITEKKHDLETLAQGLLEYETLSGDEIIGLLNGKTPVRDVGDDTPTPPRGSPVPTTGATRPKPGHEPGGGLEPQPQT